jgi:hypothetical protein
MPWLSQWLRDILKTLSDPRRAVYRGGRVIVPANVLVIKLSLWSGRRIADLFADPPCGMVDRNMAPASTVTPIPFPLRRGGPAADAPQPRYAPLDSGSAVRPMLQALPRVLRSTTRLTYLTSYVLSLGVTYSAILVARSVPRQNAVVRGIEAGASAGCAAALGRA